MSINDWIGLTKIVKDTSLLIYVYTCPFRGYGQRTSDSVAHKQHREYHRILRQYHLSMSILFLQILVKNSQNDIKGELK